MMKPSFRTVSIARLASSLGVVIALFAGGCAGERDGGTGGAEPEQALSGGSEEGASDASGVGDTHLMGHPAGCRCGICTGGRQGSEGEIGVGDEAGDVHLMGHPAGCRCGICTGGRHQTQ